MWMRVLWLMKNVARKDHKSHFLLTSSSSFHLGEPGSREKGLRRKGWPGCSPTWWRRQSDLSSMFFPRWFIPSSVTLVSLFVIVMQLLKEGQIWKLACLCPPRSECVYLKQVWSSRHTGSGKEVYIFPRGDPVIILYFFSGDANY